MKRRLQPLRREVLSDRVELFTVQEVKAAIEEYLPHLDISCATCTDLYGSIVVEWPGTGLEIGHYYRTDPWERDFYWQASIGLRSRFCRSESLVTAFFGSIDLCKEDPTFNLDISKLDMPQEDQ